MFWSSAEHTFSFAEIGYSTACCHSWRAQFGLYYRNCSHGAPENQHLEQQEHLPDFYLWVPWSMYLLESEATGMADDCCNDNWYLASNGVRSLRTLKTSRWYWCLISNKSPRPAKSELATGPYFFDAVIDFIFLSIGAHTHTHKPSCYFYIGVMYIYIYIYVMYIYFIYFLLFKHIVRGNNRLGTSSLPLSHDWRKSNV